MYIDIFYIITILISKNNLRNYLFLLWTTCRFGSFLVFITHLGFRDYSLSRVSARLSGARSMFRKTIFKRNQPVEIIFLLISAYLVTGCTSTIKSPQAISDETFSVQGWPVKDRIDYFRNSPEHVYFLNFDREGFFRNPSEIIRAERESNSFKKVLILSLGWVHNQTEGPESYNKLLQGYLNYIKRKHNHSCNSNVDKKTCLPKDWAVFCILWESDTGSFERFLGDMLPMPYLAKAISYIPDKLTIPLSFWSKSNLAERIGHSDLSDIMEVFSDDFEKKHNIKPSLYLVGHSFGARILSAFARQNLGMIKSKGFKYPAQIKGAVFIQPALVELNLPEACESQLIRSNLKDLMQKRCQSNILFPVVVTQSENDYANRFLFPLANIPLNSYTFSGIEGNILQNRYSNLTTLGRAISDFLRIPAIAWSGVATPVNYTYTQAYEIVTRKFAYLLDSVPFLGNNQHKGIFNLGAINESAASTLAPVLGSIELPRIEKINNFAGISSINDPILYIDASSEVNGHTDYEKDSIYDLIYKITSDSLSVAQ